MGTNEDYLDSLLKAAMEAESVPTDTKGNTDDASKENVTYENMAEESVAEEELASVENTKEEPAPEESTMGESTLDDNPNKQLSADEIAAMFAMAEGDAAVPEENIADEPVLEESVMEELAPEDNSNRQLSPEEIAAMFAVAEGNDAVTPEESTVEEFAPEAVAPEDAEPVVEREEAEMPKKQSVPMDEMEIDLADMSELEELLGIKDISDTDKDNSTESESESGKIQNPAADLENEDLTDILDVLGNDDGDLAEINELLKKSDQHELVDDEMLALLESVSDKEQNGENVSKEEVSQKPEDSEAKKEEKPKKKRWAKRKRAEAAEGTETEPAANGEQTEEERKPGFWGKLFQALTEEEEEADADALALEDIAEKGSAKKGKKDKGKKKKTPETNEEILEEMAEEDDAAKKGKKKKEKKPKKEKASKKKKPVDLNNFELDEPAKKLPRKMIIRIFILCFSIMAVILLVTMVVPQLLQKAGARRAFYKGEYEEAYQGLVGRTLSDSDEILLQKTEILLLLEKKVQAYEAYTLAGQDAEALSSLLEGINFYQKNAATIASLGIDSEAYAEYGNILAILIQKYSLEEEKAIEITTLDAVSYTKKVRELTGAAQTEDGAVSEKNNADNGTEAGNENAVQDENQPLEEQLEDPLQEELE